MSKIYKCIYCKEPIEDENELVIFEQGIKKKVKKKAHVKCRNEVLFKKEFFDTLFSFLEIRPIEDKNFYIVINNIRNKYTWEIMLHSLKVKENDIRKNIHMPIPYINKIISSQLPFSERDIYKQKSINKIQKELQNLSKPIIDTSQQIKYKQQENRFDISDLLE